MANTRAIRLVGLSVAEILSLLLITMLFITALQRLAQARRLASESERAP